MAEFDYKLTQENLMIVAQFLATLDLDEFIDVANHAQTVGPFLDPTLFMRGGPQLRLVKALARAAKPLQEAWNTFLEEYPEAERARISGDLARGMNLFDAMRGGPEE